MESLAGRKADALEHLGRAIEIWDGFRSFAEEDSDFDPIRDEPGFQRRRSQWSLCPPAETISVPSSSSRASATSTRWKP